MEVTSAIRVKGLYLHTTTITPSTWLIASPPHSARKGFSSMHKLH